MGRPNKNQPAIDMTDATINQEAVNGAMDAMRDQAQEDLIELLDLAGDVKAIHMADVTAKFCAAAQIQLFKKVRESKKIKDLPIRDRDGNLRRAQTLEEFCPLAFGRSYRTMMEAEEKFDLLGEESYEVASRLGLNRSALRAARALPPEKLEIVRLAISTGSAKAEVLSVIEDLAEKAEKAEAAASEANKEVAKQKSRAERQETVITELHEEVKMISRLTPEEATKRTQAEASNIQADTVGLIKGSLRQALIALNNCDSDQQLFMAGMVGQVMAELVMLRDEFSLPEVGGKPEWERWAEAQDTATAPAKAN